MNDPYKYFRIEAKDLLEHLSQGMLDLEKGRVSADVVKRLLRLAHTLKGAARVVKQVEIAEHAHAVEDLLAPHREGTSVPNIDEGLRLLDRIRACIKGLDEPEKTVESVRVEVEEADLLLQSVVDAGIQLAAARAGRDPFALDHVERELEQVREAADRMRLVPVRAMFGDLERAARDAAASLKKRVTFRATGGESRMDGRILTDVRDALLHAVRNAVAHGIESEGRVEVRVERRGGRVAFACSDDGRGIDAEAVRRAAARRGLKQTDVTDLLLNHGVSTSAATTEVSGRGVGLDVVRETVARLKGEVSLKSEPRRGTTLEIVVPMSLTSLPMLAVEAGPVVAGIPLDAVRTCTRVRDNRVLPFAPLAKLFRTRSTPACAVVVRAPSGEAAIGVDRLLGSGTEVVQPLKPWVEADPIVVGVSIDPRGRPRPILDPEALVRAARTAEPDAPEPVVTRPPLLVVDDSLTTRMLEQSILEAAGFEVDLAVSGEEALSKARSRRYGLFVVDVEMPGMDGFEYLAAVRADAALRDIPSILVTSRNTPEDKRRGADLGARAYVVKSEFDQKALLATIRGLVS